MSSLKIVFMGTPEFAIPSLEAILNAGFDVVGVLTAPDKVQGRGKLLGKSAIKVFAEEKGLNILQPERLKSSEFLDELASLRADLFVVVAFRMLPEIVWSMPKLGTFNLHASLLPDYRGAAPINWAIINGEVETGITTFFLKHEIDTGDILLQEKEPIYKEDDAGSLYLRLMTKGAQLVVKTIEMIENGTAKRVDQKVPTDIKHAPKIFRQDCEINWNQPAEKIVDFIRGLSPYPGAWSTKSGKIYKFYKVSVSERNLDPGDWQIVDNMLFIGTSSVAVTVELIQPEGKKRMETKEFLKGYKE